MIHRTQLLAAFASLLIAAGCAEEVPETPPRQLPGSPFHYPEELWDAGVEGETMLRLFVTPTGGVDSARVERSSGYPAFDSSAVAGAHDLRFDPARRGEEPIGVWVLLPVRFELPGGDSGTAPVADSAGGDTP